MTIFGIIVVIKSSSSSELSRKMLSLYSSFTLTLGVIVSFANENDAIDIKSTIKSPNWIIFFISPPFSQNCNVYVDRIFKDVLVFISPPFFDNYNIFGNNVHQDLSRLHYYIQHLKYLIPESYSKHLQ